MKKRVLSVFVLTLLLVSVFGGVYVAKPVSAIDNLLREGDDSRNLESNLLKGVTGPSAGQGETKEDYSDALMTPDNALDLACLNQSNDFAYVDGNKTRLVVGIDSENPAKISELENIAGRYQARIVNEILMQGKVKALVFELLLVSVAGFSQEVHSSELATYIEPNMKVQVQYVPDDPYWSMQWGPQKIEADWAWNTTIGDSSILVAVVDTGIFFPHPDLSASYVALGLDWTNNDSDPIDDHGHGTHCAGIIAAILNNSEGIAGLAQARVMAEKVLDSGGGGYADWVANGIIHATDCGAKIISMSIGGWGDSELIHEAVKYAYDAGVLLVAAAGNANTNLIFYPAGYDEVISVAATDEYDNPAQFSNWGDWIELAAPGVNIYSTVPGGYTSMSGTSMACPHVAGVAALAWSQYPNRTRDWVRMWLRYCADDLGAEGFDVHYGYGRVNARKAVELSPPAHELIACSWAIPPYVKPGTSAIVNATLLNFGNDETDVSFQLLANDTVVDSAMIDFLLGENSVEVTLTWFPVLEGSYNLTFYVVPVLGEVNLENNVLSRSLFVGFPVKAVVLHSAGNVYSDIIISWQTLTDEWYLFGDSMVFVDYTTLNKEDITYADIAATEADVLIISCAYDPYAGWEFKNSEIDAITRYVHEGHGLITTAGTFYWHVPNNNKLAPLFGLNDTTVWGSTQTDLLELLNTTHPLLKNVPNPFTFADVGTSIPNDRRWDSNELVDGMYLATGHYQESAIVVNRGLVYISPWLEAMPPYYHFNLQVLYNAITWSTYAKPEHEIMVSIECPNRIATGQPTLVNASVLNSGLNNETSVELRLLVNDTVVDSATIPELDASSSYTLSYLWTPTTDGRYNVTAYAPPVPNEDFTKNNVASTSVRVGYIVANVAVLNAIEIPPYFTGGWNNNYRLLVDALDAEGFYAQPITNEEIVSGELGSFDVFVMIDNVPSEAAVPYVVAFWSEGGGLVAFDSSICFLNYAGVLPPESTGSNGCGTYWDYETRSQARVSIEHPITEGYEVGEIIQGTMGDAQYRVDALASSSAYPYYTVLVEDETIADRAYVSACDSPTAGKVVHFWDQNHWGNAGLQLMITNAIDWVRSVHYEHDLAVSSVVGFPVAPGQTTAINITVRNMGLSNETDVELQLLINGSMVDETTIPELTTRRTSTISYSWTPMLAGVYNVTAYVQPVPGEGNTANNVASKNVNVQPIKYVLFDQTHGTDNIGDYKIWVRSLTEKSYVVETTNVAPITPDTLARYDVFIIPQARVPYTANELATIQDFVFGGRGLLVIGDDHPYIYSDLTGFAGIAWTSGGVSGTTIDITSHPVTAGVSSVYLNAPVAMMYVAGDAQDLVRDPVGGIMLAVSEVPSGKVLGFADEDSLKSYSIGREGNLRLADNMLDWLSIVIPVEHDLSVSLEAPALLNNGTSTLLNATVRNRGLNNETNVELQLLINSTQVSSVVISELPVGAFYTLNYNFSPPGRKEKYNVTAYVPPVPGENMTSNNVVTKILMVPYYARTYASPQWVGGGTPMEWHADDNSWEHTLPFSFPFYGVFYDKIYISSNGLITFNWPDSSLGNGVLELAGKLAIAPAWDDWTSYDPCDIYIWQNSTHIGIRWYVQHFSSGVVADFEVILGGADGVIQFDYGYSNGPVSATLGISNGIDEVLAEDVTNMNYVNTIVFSPGARPKRDIAILSVNPSTNEARPGDLVDINVVVENHGNYTEDFNVTAYAVPQNSSITASMLGSTRLYMDPPEYRFFSDFAPVGYRFNVTLRVADVADLFAWQTAIYFNGTFLRATRWFEPTWDPQYVFWSQTTVTASATSANWIVTSAALLPGATQGFNGSGTLCIIEFEITAVPQPGETYSSALLMNYPIDTFLLDRTHDIPTIVEEGYFELQAGSPSGQYMVGTVFVMGLAPGETRTLIFTWNTTDTSPGEYQIHAETSYVPDETNTEDNVFYDGIITLMPGVTFVHDVAVTNVTGLSGLAYKGWVVQMVVTVANFGNTTESFAASLYYNSTVIATLPVLNLGPNATLTLNFDWNTTSVPCQNCTVKAVASTVLGEIDTANNEFVVGNVNIRVMGDVNGDGATNMRDVYSACLAFRSFPGHLKWNPDCDLNRDVRVDMRDINAVVLNFGKHN